MQEEVIDGIRATSELKRGSVNLLTGVWTPGKVFYVDTATNGGSDSNSGLSPDDPVLKINYAMDLVTANKGDVIQILGNSPSSPNDTATITMDVAGVTLRGLHGRGLLSDSGMGSPITNTPCITMASQYLTIENLYLGDHSTGTTGGVVDISNSSFGCTIRNCMFDTQYLPAYGITTAQSQAYLLIEDCIFGRNDIAGYTTACIQLPNSLGCVVRRNLFHVQAKGILLSGAASSVSVLDNDFVLHADDAKGRAITITTNSGLFYVAGNRANYGHTDMTNNPYLDDGVAANTWGINWVGKTATLPTTT